MLVFTYVVDSKNPPIDWRVLEVIHIEGALARYGTVEGVQKKNSRSHNQGRYHGTAWRS